MLVSYDMLGLFDTFVPQFVKQYAHLANTIVTAATNYANDVRQGIYPEPRVVNREVLPCFI